MSYHKRTRTMGDDATSSDLSVTKTNGANTSIAVDTPKLAGAAMLYHGYRRTGSVIWALLYGLAGYEAPYVAVPIALAQGFGDKKPCP